MSSCPEVRQALGTLVRLRRQHHPRQPAPLSRLVPRWVFRGQGRGRPPLLLRLGRFRAHQGVSQLGMVSSARPLSSEPKVFGKTAFSSAAAAAEEEAVASGEPVEEAAAAAASEEAAPPAAPRLKVWWVQDLEPGLRQPPALFRKAASQTLELGALPGGMSAEVAMVVAAAVLVVVVLLAAAALRLQVSVFPHAVALVVWAGAVLLPPLPPGPCCSLVTAPACMLLVVATRVCLTWEIPCATLSWAKVTPTTGRRSHGHVRALATLSRKARLTASAAAAPCPLTCVPSLDVQTVCRNLALWYTT
jgi:hypothetical protein